MAVSGGTVERKNGMTQQLFSQAGAGTDNAIIAAPAAGYKIALIACLGLTLDTDGTVELQSAAEVIFRLDMKASAPFAFRGTLQQPWLECEPAEALDLITTGGAAELTLLYRIIQAK